MKKIMFILLCAVAALFLAASAGAERGKSFSVTPFVGGYTFEGNEDLEDSLIGGLRFGYNLTNNLALEGVLNYGDSEYNLTDEDVDLYGYRLEALYHFMPDSRFVPFVAVGAGGRSLRFDDTDRGDRNYLAAAYGVGLKFFFTDSLALRADVRHVIPFNDVYNNLEYTLGLTYLFGGGAAPAARAEAVVSDADGDGVIDSADECPNTPSRAKVDAVGCPLDSDKDGVADYLDKCPGTPAGVKVDKDGCPLDSDKDGVTDDRDLCPNTLSGVVVDKDGCPLDADKDGVADANDQCPNTPVGATVDRKGCPLDSDKDGVADYLDKCPNTPKGVKVDKDGCPLDSDGDGVADYLDKCPNTEKGVKVEKDGCPVLVEQKQEAKAEAVVKKMAKEKEAVSLLVEFDTAKAVVKKKYYNEVKSVADFMKEYPHSKATIEGHTDSVGNASFNKKLSQARADSVRKCLIEKFGIDASRLTAVGYGEEMPIESNATRDGRQKNRRVEAIIESTDK
ncbi:MAG: OmpA family protein [Syntrophales bacterium]|nr:OmpA family protein [Syntrophales bacterium]MDD4339857.1 OmpA family protein [Syntrophales bacterium]HOG08751.1 OmpA family protein [Syntrophales bacterium]HOS77068.1 OmpA family protein [Syntrophales bacterium]HPB69939.1 OmpA family protein [Syntrophales bacterium]